MKRIAANILDALKPPIAFEGHQCSVGASIGISIYPDDASDIRMPMKVADEAMYAVKESGRNGYRFAGGWGAEGGVGLLAVRLAIFLGLTRCFHRRFGRFLAVRHRAFVIQPFVFRFFFFGFSPRGFFGGFLPLAFKAFELVVGFTGHITSFRRLVQDGVSVE